MSTYTGFIDRSSIYSNVYEVIRVYCTIISRDREYVFFFFSLLRFDYLDFSQNSFESMILRLKQSTLRLRLVCF